MSEQNRKRWSTWSTTKKGFPFHSIQSIAESKWNCLFFYYYFFSFYFEICTTTRKVGVRRSLFFSFLNVTTIDSCAGILSCTPGAQSISDSVLGDKSRPLAAPNHIKDNLATSLQIIVYHQPSQISSDNMDLYSQFSRASGLIVNR